MEYGVDVARDGQGEPQRLTGPDVIQQEQAIKHLERKVVKFGLQAASAA